MRSCPQCLCEYITDADFCRLDGQRIIHTDSDPLIGRTIDRYEVIERLGHGGMSVVYRARHQVLGHEYALKVPYGEIAIDPEFSARLRREAMVTAQLDHPNVIKVIDFATTPSGTSFLLMELLRGRSLSRMIIDDGLMRPLDASRILRQIALGLGAVHAHGFVHRDLKPSNIMLIGDPGAEVPKILDFGLVRVAQPVSPDDTLQSKLTQAGVAMGTIYYMAPEQMRGEDATPQSDIFSLGAILFEMLSGRPPYCGTLPDILVQHAQKEPPEVPPSLGLEKVVRAMLDREPKKRPKSAEEVIEMLDRRLTTSSKTRVMRAVPSKVQPAAPPKRERRPRFAFVAMILIGLISGILWVRDPDQARDQLDAASKKLQQVDKKLVSDMADLGREMEQRDPCSRHALTSRLSSVIRKLDRAEKSVPPAQLNRLEKRASALKESVSKQVDDDRCRALARSLAKLEQDVARAQNP